MHLVTRMTGDRYTPGFHRMNILPVASPGPDESLSILLYEFDDISDFHEPSTRPQHLLQHPGPDFFQFRHWRINRRLAIHGDLELVTLRFAV